MPDGYRVEVVLVGLSMPCGMGFADDGTLFVLEGGSTWLTRPYLPARILRLDPEGRLDVVTGRDIQKMAQVLGMAVHMALSMGEIALGSRDELRRALQQATVLHQLDGLIEPSPPPV